MFTGLCHFGTWGSLGNFGIWGWVGAIFYLAFWVGLLTVLALLVVWAVRRSRAHIATVPYAVGQQTAMESLQARYDRGEITRERYENMKQNIG